MIDYKNSKIYLLRSHQTDKVYVGSTTRRLNQRLAEHKQDFKNNEKVKSRDIMKYDDCYIELYENYPCDNKEELRRKEGEIIRELDCVNKCVAGRTIKEYYMENKEKKSNYHKEWVDKNRERLNAYRREYRRKKKHNI